MDKAKVRIFFPWFLIVLIVLLIVIPLYPCNVYQEYWPKSGDSRNYIGFRPLFEVIENNYEWQFQYYAIGAGTVFNFHTNPIYFIIYPIILIAITLYFILRNKDNIKTGFIMINKKWYTLASIIISLIMIILPGFYIAYIYGYYYFLGPISPFYWSVFIISMIFGIMNLLYTIIWVNYKSRAPPTELTENEIQET